MLACTHNVRCFVYPPLLLFEATHRHQTRCEQTKYAMLGAGVDWRWFGWPPWCSMWCATPCLQNPCMYGVLPSTAGCDERCDSLALRLELNFYFCSTIVVASFQLNSTRDTGTPVFWETLPRLFVCSSPLWIFCCFVIFCRQRLAPSSGNVETLQPTFGQLQLLMLCFWIPFGVVWHCVWRLEIHPLFSRFPKWLVTCRDSSWWYVFVVKCTVWLVGTCAIWLFGRDMSSLGYFCGNFINWKYVAKERLEKLLFLCTAQKIDTKLSYLTQAAQNLTFRELLSVVSFFMRWKVACSETRGLDSLFSCCRFCCPHYVLISPEGIYRCLFVGLISRSEFMWLRRLQYNVVIFSKHFFMLVMFHASAVTVTTHVHCWENRVEFYDWTYVRLKMLIWRLNIEFNQTGHRKDPSNLHI